MKTVLTTIAELPEPLRAEYEAKPDGRFVLKLEGDPPPGFVKVDDLTESNKKLAEFRDNNRALMAKATELETRLKVFDGIDPEAHKALVVKLEEIEKSGVKKPDDVTALVAAQVRAATDPIQKKLEEAERREAEKTAALARKELESTLRNAGSKVGVADAAIVDFLKRGLEVFVLEDGKPVAKDGDQPRFSKLKPAEPLSPEEWALGLAEEAPHLFKPSGGGGAKPGATGPAQPKRLVSSDPLEVGRNLDAIAKGEVGVAG